MTPEQHSKKWIEDNMLIRARPCTDVFWLIFFFAYCAGSAAVIIASWLHANSITTQTYDPFAQYRTNADIIGIALACSLAVVPVWLSLLFICPTPTIYTSTAVATLIVAVGSYYFGSNALASPDRGDQFVLWCFCVLCWVTIMALLAWVFSVHKKLPFTFEVLRNTRGIYSGFPGSLVFSALLVLTTHCLVFVAAAAGLIWLSEWDSVIGLMAVLLALMWWVHHFSAHLLRVLVSSLAITWYFGQGKEYLGHCTVLTFLCRALTTSLGAIAKGSFLSATVAPWTTIVNFFSQRVCTHACCTSRCCQPCLGRWYLGDKLGDIFVGGLGESYSGAGSLVARLLEAYSVQPLLRHELALSFLFGPMPVLLAFALALFAIGVYLDSLDREFVGIAVFLALYLVFTITTLLFQVPLACVHSLLICFCLDQDQFKYSGYIFGPPAFLRLMGAQGVTVSKNADFAHHVTLHIGMTPVAASPAVSPKATNSPRGDASRIQEEIKEEEDYDRELDRGFRRPQPPAPHYSSY